jgi:hypothetical protein
MPIGHGGKKKYLGMIVLGYQQRVGHGMSPEWRGGILAMRMVSKE